MISFEKCITMRASVRKRMVTKHTREDKGLNQQKRSSSFFKRLMKIVFALLAVFLVVGVLCVVAFYKLVLYNAPMVDPDELTIDKKILITIPRGSTLRDVAIILEESRVIADHRLFIWAAKYRGAEHQVKAGKYLLPVQASNHQIISILKRTKPQSIRVTVPEGRTIPGVLSALQKQMPVNPDSFRMAMMDTAMIRSLGLKDTSLFGYLMPNTYEFDPGVTEREIVRIMAADFVKFYDDELKKRAEHLRMSMREVITLASIIEGETSDEDERYLVSAVYHNRLKKRMLLQADPTIQFITGDQPRRLYFRDLEIDHPYNTYKYKGLPPGPVNNPGKASILAALYPARVNYLYMVADGKGRHVFSANIRDHLKAKKKLDQLRKKLNVR